MNRRAGIIHLEFNGKGYDAKGNWTINPGRPKREAILGAGGRTLGYKEVLDTPPTIKGQLVLSPTVDIDALYNADEVTITLSMCDKVYTISSGWLSEAEISTEEGTMDVTFHGLSMTIDKARS